jgi:hypothetical protein
MCTTTQPPQKPASYSGRVSIAIARFIAVVLFFCVLALNEEDVARRPTVPEMVDHPFRLAQPINDYLREHDVPGTWGSLWVSTLLFADSLLLWVIAAVAVGVLLSTSDFTMITAMLLEHLLRAICLRIVEMPPPKHKLWRKPGFPSFGENDYFYSGHTGLVTVCAVDLWNRCHRRWAVAVHVSNLLQAIFMVTFQVHYTVDLITGCMAGYCCYRCAVLLGDWLVMPLNCLVVAIRAALLLGPLDFSRESLAVAMCPPMSPPAAMRLSALGCIGFVALLYWFDSY